MRTSISVEEIGCYVRNQLNHFFPDKTTISLTGLQKSVSNALERLDFCFKHSALNSHFSGGESNFNHLYSDHYVMFLWFLSRAAWLMDENNLLCDKLFCLNKALNGFQASYTTKLPDVFFVFHGVATVLGKADYSEYLVVLHGCTIGTHGGAYPQLGRGIGLAANTSLIGGCNIGERVSIGSNTSVFNRNIPSDHLVYTTPGQPMKVCPSARPYAQEFFNFDLSLLPSSKNDSK